MDLCAYFYSEPIPLDLFTAHLDLLPKSLGAAAADSPPALLVYNAELELVSANGSRWVPYHGFWTGYKQTGLRASELIRRIRLPRAPAAPALEGLTGCRAEEADGVDGDSGPELGPALIVGYATPPGHAFSTAVARLCAVLREAVASG